jgi:glycine/D-amino acid oxidase-like deaminating enzyme
VAAVGAVTFDVAVVGGGIVGLSTAMEIGRRRPDARIVLIEKEDRWAAHQSGHNSGVIHSGIYYRPGSFKARFCREGNRSMVAFCQQHDIPHEICGKVIVATEAAELPQLEALHQRGLANGLEVRQLTPGAGDGGRAARPQRRRVAGAEHRHRRLPGRVPCVRPDHRGPGRGPQARDHGGGHPQPRVRLRPRDRRR